RERADQAEAQNIDLYEAVAGLYETISDLTQQNAALEKRVTTLEGGQNK
ncbi:MAG TPA: transcription factor, partial [Ruminococcaceae bacterium]|nr:transcription factor [Oscillospiraceae bacterium]